MLTARLETLTVARRNGTAVAAFNIYNFEGLRAAVLAAEHLQKPIIVQTSLNARAYGRHAQFTAAMSTAAGASSCSIGVQLDHARNVEQVMQAVREDYTSVMVDGSALPFGDNVRLTRAASRVAHKAGKGVEAELGRTAGEEDWSSGELPDRTMTEPDAAAEFVQLTGIDALAVNIGNAHGNYIAPPTLDLDRLADIATRVAIPIVLHGASGIPAGDLRRAIALGVAKVNFNSDLRQAYFDVVDQFSARQDRRLLELMEACSAAMQSVMEARILLLSGDS